MTKIIAGLFNNNNIYYLGLKDSNNNIILEYNNTNYPYEAIIRMLPYDSNSKLFIDKTGNKICT